MQNYIWCLPTPLGKSFSFVSLSRPFFHASALVILIRFLAPNCGFATLIILRGSSNLIKVVYSKVWMTFDPLGEICIFKKKLVRQLGFFPPPVSDMWKEMFLTLSLRYILFAFCPPTHKALLTFVKENNIGSQPSIPIYLIYHPPT